MADDLYTKGYCFYVIVFKSYIFDSTRLADYEPVTGSLIPNTRETTNKR
jgi:hypothetical protein